MRKIYANGASAASATYGNISTALKEYILSNLPKNSFNDIHISSTFAFRGIKERFLSNFKKRDFYNKNPPYMLITPTYTTPTDDLFMANTIMTKNSNNMVVGGIDRRYLMPLINDQEKKIRVLFRFNHDRIDFNVSMTFRTLHEQLDQMKYLKNQMVWDTTFAFDTALEAIIPRTIMSYLGRMVNINIDNKEDYRAPLLIDYCNRWSGAPITYKLRNSSALDEFFMYYQHRLLVTLTDLEINQGSRKGMLDDEYEVSFRASIEFNLPGMFYLEAEANNDYGLEIDIRTMDSEKSVHDIIPIYTINGLFNKYPPYLDGKRLYHTAIIEVEPDEKHNDSLQLKSLFDRATYEVLREDIISHVRLDTIIQIYMLKDQDVLKPGEHFNIYWNNMELIIYDVDPSSTYRLIIYLNTLQMNDRLSVKIEELSSDKPNYTGGKINGITDSEIRDNQL